MYKILYIRYMVHVYNPLYTLHGACIQSPVSILRDPKGSRPDGACEVSCQAVWYNFVMMVPPVQNT
jgi:hypothetical protein